MTGEGGDADLVGHGPLQELFNDESVTEILVNGISSVWCERNGALEEVKASFSSEDQLRRYVRKILAPYGRKVDQRSPFADVVLEGGIRAHVSVPPISRFGICISVRKPPKDLWTLPRLVGSSMMGERCAESLRKFVAEKRNIFVCGGTGSGKTSLLSALLSQASPRDRIIALEDISELRTSHPHFLSLEARPPNQEGEGELLISRLLRESLRMRPDRIVMGECRGMEALDLIMALNTGHRGSMGTIHANSPRDALHRLELLALLAAENLRESAVKSLVASSVHVVIHVERFSGGRRIAQIAEVKGVEGGNYLLKALDGI